MSIRTVIAVATTLTATLVPVSSAAAAPAATTQVKVISSCTAAKYKPTRYILFCGDANQGMTHASYKWWSAKTAHGTATFYYNDCTPNCAAGHFHQMQAEFTLFRVVKTTQYGPLFSRASIDTRQGHQIYDLPTSTM